MPEEVPPAFLLDFDAWDEGFAAAVVRGGGGHVGLTDAHRRVIAFLRAWYRRTGSAPTVLTACRATGLDLPGLTVLFPGGYRWGACRAAGLPFGPAAPGRGAGP